jgi:hypothetical protein
MSSILSYFIQIMLPDGPHWYCGQQTMETPKGNVVGTNWTPYITKAIPLPSSEAMTLMPPIIKQNPEAKMLTLDQCEKPGRYYASPTVIMITQKYIQPGMVIVYLGQKSVVLKREINGVYIERLAFPHHSHRLSPKSKNELELVHQNIKQYIIENFKDIPYGKYQKTNR